MSMMAISLSERQLEAVDLCINSPSRVVSVTGPAGTGKTTIMLNVRERLAGKRVALCAPTGKAAKRIQEATGIAATTLHRLLEYAHPGPPTEENPKPVSDGPARNSGNPLNFDIIIVDEFSMMNTEMFNDLKAAMPPGSRLLAFGDINQLPPIESQFTLYDAKTYESPFARLIAKFPTIYLKDYYRTDEGSAILLNSQRILQKRPPVKGEGFNIVIVNDPIEFIMARYDLTQAFGANTQIIMPKRQHKGGSDEMNLRIQELASKGDFIEYSIDTYGKDGKKKKRNVRRHVGDKVIVTSNFYDLSPMCDSPLPIAPELQAFNGEIGKIIYFDGENVRCDMYDRQITMPDFQKRFSVKHQRSYPIDPRENLDLAFAITTHKAQGSEYDHVVYVLTDSMVYSRLLNWRNSYTALTRARKSVTVISSQWAYSKLTQEVE